MENKSKKFFNRELSWIEFNARVLTEACKKTVPLLERLRYLAIVSSNFDEFFMVRVAGLKNQEKIDPDGIDVAGLTAKQQLDKIKVRVNELFSIQHEQLEKKILPALKKEGLEYVPAKKYSPSELHFVEDLFDRRIFPLLTPLRVSSSDALPHIANLRLHVAFLLRSIVDQSEISSPLNTLAEKTPLAFVQVPPGEKRVIWFPSENESAERRFTLLDDVIIYFGTKLFPGYAVTETLVFKSVCDAAFAVDEERDEDFIAAMEEILRARQDSVPIRLTCNGGSQTIVNMLMKKAHLTEKDIYTSHGIIDLASVADIASADGFSHLRYPSWKNFYPAILEKGEPFWDSIKKRDMLLHVPYESYEPVVTFIKKAAEDANVLAIKMTLYRTSGDSPIVRALEDAAHNGKQVTVFVELKARFDEKQNIAWAQKLEQAGVIVVYGIANLKVHAKMLLVVRKEFSGIVRYVHMATGNYNDKTARFYVDMSLFTVNPEIATDASMIFNVISGYSAIQSMESLFMAPINLKSRLLAMIEREIQHSSPETPGFIMAKMNSLSHPEIIEALYKASCAHVKVLLNVRGICMLVPGVKEQSENISVISIVDRFLEHTRIFYFQNGGADEIYLSSADCMPRNLDKRVELLFPVLQEDNFEIIKNALLMYFKDNTQAHYLTSTGKWIEKKPMDNEKPFRAQEYFYNHYKHLAEKHEKKTSTEFTVRRREPLLEQVGH